MHIPPYEMGRQKNSFCSEFQKCNIYQPVVRLLSSSVKVKTNNGKNVTSYKCKRHKLPILWKQHGYLRVQRWQITSMILLSQCTSRIGITPTEENFFISKIILCKPCRVAYNMLQHCFQVKHFENQVDVVKSGPVFHL